MHVLFSVTFTCFARPVSGQICAAPRPVPAPRRPDRNIVNLGSDRSTRYLKFRFLAKMDASLR